MTSSFPPTRWSAIVRVQDHDSELGHTALRDLCGMYWAPLYAFARRLGYATHDAEDLTQGFFSYLLEKQLFAAADPDRGKLRTFLLTTFQRYITDVRERAQALKRGGGRELLSLDVAFGEERYVSEPQDAATPEHLFERTWAMEVLRHACQALSAEEKAGGRGEQFALLEPFLSLAGEDTDSYQCVAQKLQWSEPAVRQAVARLRKKLRAALAACVAETLATPSREQVEAELRELRSALES